MSWFASSLSRSIPTSPLHQDRVEQDDTGETPSHLLPAAKVVKDEFSALTKSLTRQLWGVASFLAPPPIERTTLSSPVESSKHVNASQSVMVAGDAEEGHNAGLGFDGLEGKEGIGVLSEVAISGVESLADVSNSSTSSSLSAGGQRLTGFRSDLAELRGTMATGLSQIQSIIRVVTEEDEDGGNEAEASLEGDESGNPRSPAEEEDETQGIPGLNSFLMPLLGGMLSSRDRGEESLPTPANHGEEDEDDGGRSKEARPSALASSIGGLSKLASSLLPFARDIVGEFSGRDYFAVALTEEVVAFANSIAMHPETWLDFPLPEEEDDFVMTEAQQEHAEAVEQVASRLAVVHDELCPASMSDRRFWKIYFVLLHSRLSKEDAELLSTPQVLKTRELLLQQIRKREPVVGDPAPARAEREELGIMESSMAHLDSAAQAEPSLFAERASTNSVPQARAELPPQEAAPAAADAEAPATETSAEHFSVLTLEDDEADADAWLDEEDDDNEAAGAGAEGAVAGDAIASAGAMENLDEDVSFSDLEDDDDEHE